MWLTESLLEQYDKKLEVKMCKGCLESSWINRTSGTSCDQLLDEIWISCIQFCGLYMYNIDVIDCIVRPAKSIKLNVAVNINKY